ncbi:MAG: hypothetical protein PHF30_05140 [Bacilli bacterium]|nr:hypothetical protein [Bacilli bacterium]
MKNKKIKPKEIEKLNEKKHIKENEVINKNGAPKEKIFSPIVKTCIIIGSVILILTIANMINNHRDYNDYEEENTTTKNTTIPVTTEKKEEISWSVLINDVVLYKGHFDPYKDEDDNYYRKINTDKTNVTIKVESNHPDYRFKPEFNYELKDGWNEIIIGKHESHQGLDWVFTIFKSSNNEKLTKQTTKIKNMIDIVNNYEKRFHLFRELFEDEASITEGDCETNDGGMGCFKCISSYCKTIPGIKEYIQKNYKLSYRFADEIINFDLFDEILIELNKEIYFRPIPMGRESWYEFNSYYEYNNNTYLIFHEVDHLGIIEDGVKEIFTLDEDGLLDDIQYFASNEIDL